MKTKKEQIICILEKIANLDFQRKVWVSKQNVDIIFSLGEAVNTLDDYCFFDDIEEGKLVLCNSEHQKNLESFVQNILNYLEPENTEEILYDEKWKAISNQASEIVEYIKNHDFNPPR